MKKLLIIAVLGSVIIIGAFYKTAITQPIPTGFDPTAVRYGDTLTGAITATFESDGSTATTFGELSVSLGTQTSGNYVATIADSGNSIFTVSGSGSESAAVLLNLTASGIRESHLKIVDSATDEDIFTYESTTGDFEWHTIVQMLALTDTDSLSEGSSNLYQDSEVTNWIDDVTLGSSGALTIPTGQAFVVGTTTWTSSDEIDGTKIKDADYGDVDVSAGGAWTLDTDSVADNEIDYSAVTLADFDYQTNWRIFYSDGSGDVTELALGANGTFLESNGASSAPAFRTLIDGDVPDNITIDLATLASTVTYADNESTAENNAVVFLPGGDLDGGNLAPEVDGDFHYNPSTGTVTATEFVGGGAGLTSTLTDNSIVDTLHRHTELVASDGSPDPALSVDFAGRVGMGTSAPDGSLELRTGNSIIRIRDTGNTATATTSYIEFGGTTATNWDRTGFVGDSVSGDTHIRLCAEDSDLILGDSSGVSVLTLSGGDVTVTGALEGATLTEGGNAVPNATDHLGFFGGTTSAELAAEISNETGSGVLAFATAPVFTTSIQLTGADADPAAAGEIRYDNTITGIMSGGGLRWYDDDSVRLLVDLETDPTDDDYVVAYDSTADGFYMKADADSGGSTAYDNIGNPTGAGSIGFDDTETATYSSATTATDFFTVEGTGNFGDISIVKIEQKTGNPTDGTLLEIITADNEDDPDQLLLGNGSDDYVTFKIIEAGTFTIDVTSDGTAAVVIPDPITANGGLTSSGTIEAGTLTEGGVAIYNDNEMDAFSELDAIVTDKSLVNLEDGGTFTGGIIANGNLSVGNATTTAGVLTLLEDDDDGANFASFMVPALAANTVYTLPPDDGDNTEVLQTNGSGTLTWVANASGGATAWDDIGDPDAAATVDFVTYTQTIDIGKSDSGGGSGLVLDVTGLGAGTDDVIGFEITTTADNDSDYVPLAVYDDSGVGNQLLFNIDYQGGIHFREGAYITNNSNDHIVFSEHDDSFYMYFDGNHVGLAWTDGELKIANQEDGVDAIINMMGKDAGEKAILRVWSAAHDKYIELYHDDTDAHIISSSGDIHIEAAGGDINFADDNITTTGTATFAGGTLTGAIDISGATVTMPKRTKNDDRFYVFNLFNPNSLYDKDTQVCFEPNLPANITITEVQITCDADPATELDIDLKWADAFIGLGNATLIEPIDTTNGTTDIDSGFDDATVAAGKCMYIEMAADPDSNITQAIVKIRYDYD